MRSLRPFLLLALLAFVLHVAIALGLATDEPDDGRVYTRLAHNVVNAGVYSIDEQPPLRPTYIRVPGYPLFIAAIYRVAGDWNNAAVRATQALVDTATCGLVALLAAWWAPATWDEARRRRAALAAFGLAAVCPFPLIYPAALLTETLALFLGTGTVVLTMAALEGRARERASRAAWIATGALAGLAALVRPENGLYLAVAGAMLVLAGIRDVGMGRRVPGALRRVARRSLVQGAALAAGFVIVLAPWTVRNAVVFGIVQPLNPKSVSMPDEFVPYGYETWVRTWIDHPRYVGPILFSLDADRIETRQIPASAFDSDVERAAVDELLTRYNTPAPDADPDALGHWPPGGMTPEIDAGFAAIARDRIARHPVRYYVTLPVTRVLALWFNPHADFYPFAGYLLPIASLDRDRAQQFWLPLFLALLVAWTAAGWAGTWVVWRGPGGGPIVLLLALLIVPRLVLLSWLPNPEPRYTVEFFPLVSALAGCWLASIVRPAGR